ncbi:hypothetical protein ABZ807_27730 [Micromonospora sp. NPDC047548]|uniref:hypothetical protein n=1 Tax=Micromonospora sp. NPDC047548 TaxID=3155624 RepID=UPI0033DB00D8
MLVLGLDTQEHSEKEPFNLRRNGNNARQATSDRPSKRAAPVTNFAAAGASCLIVSGYIDSHRGIHIEYLTHAALTVLRMRCDQPELRRRLENRARPGEQRESALREAEAFDRSQAEVFEERDSHAGMSVRPKAGTFK